MVADEPRERGPAAKRSKRSARLASAIAFFALATNSTAPASPENLVVVAAGSTGGGAATGPAGPRLPLPTLWEGSVRRAIQSSATAASTLPSGSTGIPACTNCDTRGLLIFNRRASSVLEMVGWQKIKS
jgi:hypothetical protein